MPRQRDEHGRFLPGNTVGKKGGRPPKKREEKYMERFRQAVSLSDWTEATQGVLERAKEGSVAAWRALAEYAMGKPATKIDAMVRQESLSVDVMVAIEKAYGEEE